MKIEIGKTYLIYPYNKWSVNEEELLVGSEDKKFILRTEWKGGTFLVTPQDEDECEVLQIAVDAEDDDRDNELVSSYFAEFELYETTDGNNEIDFTLTEFTDEEQEQIQETYDEDWFSGLEELGYSPEDGWFTLWGKVVAEEYANSDTE